MSRKADGNINLQKKHAEHEGGEKSSIVLYRGLAAKKH